MALNLILGAFDWITRKWLEFHEIVLHGRIMENKNLEGVFFGLHVKWNIRQKQAVTYKLITRKIIAIKHH